MSRVGIDEDIGVVQGQRGIELVVFVPVHDTVVVIGTSGRRNSQKCCSRDSPSSDAPRGCSVLLLLGDVHTAPILTRFQPTPQDSFSSQRILYDPDVRLDEARLSDTSTRHIDGRDRGRTPARVWTGR